jgi:capsid portal protein
MKVKNMTSEKGNKIANQFIIEEHGGIKGNFIKRETFQSYESIIAIKTTWQDEIEIELDKNYWNYSRTTGKYRNIFLQESKKDTEKNIKNGVYKLANLNN